MQIQNFSPRFMVKQLESSDAAMVYMLYQGNPQYFDAMQDAPTLESAKADLTALPPKKTAATP